MVRHRRTIFTPTRMNDFSTKYNSTIINNEGDIFFLNVITIGLLAIKSYFNATDMRKVYLLFSHNDKLTKTY